MDFTLENLEYNRLTKNPKLLFSSRYFKQWLQSFRWLPKVISNKTESFTIQILKKIKAINQKQLFICHLKYNQLEYFLPLIKVSDQKYVPELLNTNYFLMINQIDPRIKTICYAAEYDVDFWKTVILKTKKKYAEIKNIKDADYIKKIINSEEFSIKILGAGNTTNVVLKFSANNLKSIVCKVYKNLMPNLEITILTHLSKFDYKNIPIIYAVGQIPLHFTKKDNKPVQILFSEFINSDKDAGSVFWNQFHDYILDADINLIYMEKEKYDNFFYKIFETSSKYAEKIGQSVRELHNLLKRSDESYLTDSKHRGESTNVKINFQEEQYQKQDFERLNRKIRGFLTEFINDEHLIDEHLLEIFKLNPIHFDLFQKYLNKQLIHQDLHLGQMIIGETPDRDPILLDFEGDPQLSIEERLEKHPVIQDLASIKRAFSYIKYNALVSFFKKKFNPDVLSYIFSNKIKLEGRNIEIMLFIITAIFKNAQFEPASTFCKIVTHLIEYYCKSINLDMNSVIDKMNESQVIAEFDCFEKACKFDDLFAFVDNWERWIYTDLLTGYYGDEIIELDIEKIFRISLVFSLQRALMELRYERTFRPFEQIVPLLGFIDLLKETKKLKEIINI